MVVVMLVGGSGEWLQAGISGLGPKKSTAQRPQPAGFPQASTRWRTDQRPTKSTPTKQETTLNFKSDCDSAPPTSRDFWTEGEEAGRIDAALCSHNSCEFSLCHTGAAFLKSLFCRFFPESDPELSWVESIMLCCDYPVSALSSHPLPPTPPPYAT